MFNYKRLFNITEFAAVLDGLPKRYKVDFLMGFNYKTYPPSSPIHMWF